MANRQRAKIQIQNLYLVSKEFGQLPSRILRETTVDEYSMDLLVIREGRPKEGK